MLLDLRGSMNFLPLSEPNLGQVKVSQEADAEKCE